jgi:hypothetical protein
MLNDMEVKGVDVCFIDQNWVKRRGRKNLSFAAGQIAKVRVVTQQPE